MPAKKSVDAPPRAAELPYAIDAEPDTRIVLVAAILCVGVMISPYYVSHIPEILMDIVCTRVYAWAYFLPVLLTAVVLTGVATGNDLRAIFLPCCRVDLTPDVYTVSVARYGRSLYASRITQPGSDAVVNKLNNSFDQFSGVIPMSSTGAIGSPRTNPSSTTGGRTKDHPANSAAPDRNVLVVAWKLQRMAALFIPAFFIFGIPGWFLIQSCDTVHWAVLPMHLGLVLGCMAVCGMLFDTYANYNEASDCVLVIITAYALFSLVLTIDSGFFMGAGAQIALGFALNAVAMVCEIFYVVFSEEKRVRRTLDMM